MMKKAQLVLVDGWGMKAEDALHPLFSSERMNRIRLRKTENMRLDSACAELAYLCASLFFFGDLADRRYAYGDNDKPYFVSPDSGFLSIAHAGGIGACLIADVPVGCDTEARTRNVDKIEGRIRSAFSEEKEDALTLWCIKESFVKLTGEGLSRPFRSLAYADGEILSEDGKTLSKVKYGECGRCVWAFASFGETEAEITLLSAEEALEILNKKTSEAVVK